MLRPGLVSVTFRALTPSEIIALCVRAQIVGIEWGGDVHVPPGDLENARVVSQKTRDAGLMVAAYGSYYRAGYEEPDAFARIFETARALGTPLIRVWAGKVGSDKASWEEREKVVADLLRISAMAAQADTRIACEWHGGTLTDTANSATALLNAAAHPALGTYWQPRRQMPPEDCLRDMDAALPCLCGLHVFQWHPETGERLPLRDGVDDWTAYLEKAVPFAKSDRFALLEFVQNDSPEQFLDDAAVLCDLLAALPI